MLFQRKIDGAMKKLHEGSDAAENAEKKRGSRMRRWNVRNWKRGIFLQ